MTAGPGPVARIKIHEQGPEFSRVIWGSMRSEEQFSSASELAGFLDFLLERSITTLDTAATYGAPYSTERFLGKALKEHGGRDRFEIVTKCGICRPGPVIPEFRTRYFDSSPEHIRWSVDRSLSELGIDVIDVLLLHRADHLMEPAATAAALDDIVRQGKVRHIGVSNYLPSRFELLQSHLTAPLVTNQVQFSPIYLRPVTDGTFDLALKLGHKPMIWSPVGGGRLLTSDAADTAAIRALLAEIARRMDLPGPAEAAMAFVGRHPVGGMPIVGSGKRERVDGAIRALNSEFARDDWYEIVSQVEPDAGDQGMDAGVSDDKAESPVSAARRLARQELPRRFYATAGVAEHAQGFALTLDGRQARTPGRNPLVVPSRPVAQALAAEWQGQGEHIDPATMPLTRIVHSAIDRVAREMAPVRAEIAKYAGSDLVCYRGEGPGSLVAAQEAAWGPVLAWARESLGARFRLVEGIVAVEQPAESLAAVAAALAGLDPLRLAAVHVVTTLTGSALIALAVLNHALTPEEAWAAAHVDEDWQMEQWGRDETALSRRAARWREMQAAALILRPEG